MVWVLNPELASPVNDAEYATTLLGLSVKMVRGGFEDIYLLWRGRYYRITAFPTTQQLVIEDITRLVVDHAQQRQEA